MKLNYIHLMTATLVTVLMICIIAAPAVASGYQGQSYKGTPAMIPGTIQAENYDIGGQSVAYYDTTSQNRGGAYRQDAVDIESGATGDVIAYVKSSEWLTYTVEVQEAGTYAATLHASSPYSGRQIWVWVDGILKAQVNTPATGSFGTYKDATAQFTLPKGSHYVRLEFRGDSQNLDYMTLAMASGTGGTESTPTTTPSGHQFQPYQGTPAAVPGTIQAENYDTGGQGVAYYDTTAENRGGAYRSDAVDIETGATGDVIAYVKSSEWLTYTVDIQEAGTYEATLHASSPYSGRQVWIWVDGILKAQVNTPDTGSFDTYQDATAELTLPQGSHYIRLEFRGDSQNLDYMTLGMGTGGTESTPTPTVTATVTPTPTVGPVSADFVIEIPTGSNWIMLIDMSVNAATVRYDLGDGVSSKDLPAHGPTLTYIYLTAGTYTITQTAIGASGEIATKQITVTLEGPTIIPTTTTTQPTPTPVADFSANVTNGPAPLAVRFNDASTGSPTTWSWDFGDGNTSTEQSPAHVYTAAGNYTVNLWAINSGGSNNMVMTNYITVTAPVTPMPTTTVTTTETTATPTPTTTVTTTETTTTPTPTPTSAGSNSSIIIQNFAFSPASLSITTGTTVAWTNQDAALHQIASDSGPVSFSSDPLAQGASFTVMFTTPGTYTYHCTIHPSMTGTIVVQQS